MASINVRCTSIAEARQGNGQTVVTLNGDGIRQDVQAVEGVAMDLVYARGVPHGFEQGQLYGISFEKLPEPAPEEPPV